MGTVAVRLWPGGGLICLGTAYFGNILNTPGYDVVVAATPEQKARAFERSMAMLKVNTSLVVAAFMLNYIFPSRLFQSGAFVVSAILFTNALPMKPMPGHSIWKKSPWLWARAFAVIGPMYYLFNFVL